MKYLIIFLSVFTICYVVYHTHLNAFHNIGALYWVIRDIGTDKNRLVEMAIVKQTAYPWRTGKGIQFKFGKYLFQIGLCRPHRELGRDDQAGLLHVLDGKLLDEDIDAIRSWK